MLGTVTCTTGSANILSSGITEKVVPAPDMQWVQRLGYRVEEESWFSLLQ